MGLATVDFVLLIITILIVIVDIVLALCIRYVLPYHITQRGWYAADGTKYEFKDAVQICPCLSRIFPDDTKVGIAFKKIPKQAISKRQVNDVVFQRMDKYPYLVSLSIPAYSDDLKQKMFACNGLILSTEKLLTTENCVRDDLEWYNLTVRSRSPYWSKYGATHSVIDMSSTGYEGFVELRVLPKFSESLVSVLPIKYPFNGNWTYAVSIGWNEKMYKQSLNYRYKHNIFDVEEWTSIAHTANQSKIFYKSASCERTSRPLITSCHQLLGTVLDSEAGCQGFLAFNASKSNDEKLVSHRLIYQDTGVLKDVEICQN